MSEIRNLKYIKAAILEKQKRPLVVKEISLPTHLLRGQVLVKNLYSGVCGSQLGEIEGVKGKDIYLPHLLGHEGIAEVIQVGPGVRKIKKSDFVLQHWMLGPGLQAESIKYFDKNKIINAGPIATFSSHSIISENRLTKINKRFRQKKEVLLLGCTLSTAIGSTNKLTKCEKDFNIAVVGCGSIGLGIIRSLNFQGFKNIYAIDIENNKLIFSKTIGSKFIINIKKQSLKNFFYNSNIRLDRIFETTGNNNIVSEAFECLKHNGEMILIGVPNKNKKAKFYTLDINLGKKLIGCKGGNFDPKHDINKYLEKYINNKKFNAKKLITNEATLNDINDVISQIKKNKILSKCIINLTSE